MLHELLMKIGLMGQVNMPDALVNPFNFASGIAVQERQDRADTRQIVHRKNFTGDCFLGKHADIDRVSPVEPGTERTGQDNAVGSLSRMTHQV